MSYWRQAVAWPPFQMHWSLNACYHHMRYHEINSFTCDLQMLRDIYVSQQENKIKCKILRTDTYTMLYLYCIIQKYPLLDVKYLRMSKNVPHKIRQLSFIFLHAHFWILRLANRSNTCCRKSCYVPIFSRVLEETLVLIKRGLKNSWTKIYIQKSVW